MEQKYSLKKLALTGVMAALVFVASLLLQIPIPTPIDNTRLHLGNVMCLLSGLLLGPVGGGFSAGIGSLFFDLLNPMYIADAPITFFNKFMMGFTCGLIAWGGKAAAQNVKRNFIACTAGALLYVLLYLGHTFVKNYYFLKIELETVLLTITSKAVVSTINGIFAVVIAVPLAMLVRAALKARMR